MNFEWSATKNRLNKKKHRVSFETARYIFHDPHILSVLDIRFSYQEERWQSIGRVNNVALHVAHLIIEGDHHEEETIRLISARLASDTEESRYEAARGSHQ